MDLGNSILETEDVGKSNQSSIPKKKRLTKLSPSKVHVPTSPVYPPPDREEVVIIAKKKVPGMIPRVPDRRSARRF
jgi:hypothetical protein